MGALALENPIAHARPSDDQSPGLLMVPVLSNNMEPSLRSGLDFVVLRPVDRFQWDEVYGLKADDQIVLYRCQSRLNGRVHVFSDNKLYSSFEVSRDEFAEMVAGIVVGDLRVRDHRALPQAPRHTYSFN